MDNMEKHMDTLKEMKFDAMKKINMEINRVNRLFDEIEKELKDFQSDYKKAK